MARCVTAAFAACLVVISSLATGASASSVIQVDCRVGGDLQAALDAAVPGDRVEVRGRCVGAFVVRAPGTILVGRGHRPTLSGGPGVTGPVLSVLFLEGPPTRVRGLTIANGATGVVGHNLTLTDVTVRDNDGAGVVAAFDYGPVRIRRSRIIRNGGSYACAIDNNNPLLTITDTVIRDSRECGISNTSSINIKPTLVLVRSKILNTAGRGILNTWLLTIKDSLIRGNDARGSWFEPTKGGGIYNALDFIPWDGGFVTLVRTRIIHNRAKVGGGIYSTGRGFLTRTRSVIAHNRRGNCVVVPIQMGTGPDPIVEDPAEGC